jgi:hypothetical protein
MVHFKNKHTLKFTGTVLAAILVVSSIGGVISARILLADDSSSTSSQDLCPDSTGTGLGGDGGAGGIGPSSGEGDSDSLDCSGDTSASGVTSSEPTPDPSTDQTQAPGADNSDALGTGCGGLGTGVVTNSGCTTLPWDSCANTATAVFSQNCGDPMAPVDYPPVNVDSPPGAQFNPNMQIDTSNVTSSGPDYSDYALCPGRMPVQSTIGGAITCY